MIPFKLGNKEFQLPSSFEEMTFRQFFAVRDCGEDLLLMLEALTKISKKELSLIPDLDLELKILPFLEFMKGDFDLDKGLVPDQIEVDGKLYPLPGGIGINTFGQKLALQDAILDAEKKGKSEVDIYPYALALYFQPIITGKPYDQAEVDLLVDKMLDVKLGEGWPVASFFLSRYEKYLIRRKSGFLTHLHRRRAEQVLTDLKDSVIYLRYSPLRRFLIKILMGFYKLTGTPYLRSFNLRKKRQNIKKN